jgi:NAD(P)-dependent dehydrogenase (short-subunit alcohol dehydrogenase family)
VEANLPLAGQVALITGCARPQGLGHAIALALAEAGADVAVNDVADETGGLVDLVTAIDARGRKAIRLLGDVAGRESAEEMVATTVSRLGRLDILVNNAAAAGVDHHHVAWEISEEAYDAVMRVNTRGVFMMSTAAARVFLRDGVKGRIVNIASDAGKRGYPRRSVYCASKFAVVGLTQAMAIELASHGVTVNAICPGVIDTAKRAPGDPAVASITVPVGRQGLPVDIARAVVFLADPNADYITGQSVSVNGGIVM